VGGGRGCLASISRLVLSWVPLLRTVASWRVMRGRMRLGICPLPVVVVSLLVME
jgi:hypothetical protein